MMASESSSMEPSGPLGVVFVSLPPIEVDCSAWVSESSSYPEVEFVPIRKSLAPVETEDVFLKLTFMLAPGADANQMLDRVTKLFERVNDLEKSLGGAGIRWDREGADDNGTLHLVLRSNDTVAAEQRLQTLATLVVATVAEFKTVHAVSARGCRRTEPERPFFEITATAA